MEYIKFLISQLFRLFFKSHYLSENDDEWRKKWLALRLIPLLLYDGMEIVYRGKHPPRQRASNLNEKSCPPICSSRMFLLVVSFFAIKFQAEQENLKFMSRLNGAKKYSWKERTLPFLRSLRCVFLSEWQRVWLICM